MIILRKIYFLFFIVVFLLQINSCKEKNGQEKPSNILKKEVMVDVLCDIHLTDAILQLKSNQPKDFIHLNSSKMYDSILKENKISAAQFDSSLKYYTSQPEQMKGIYEQVVQKISLKN
jgi:hypothetical protein